MNQIPTDVIVLPSGHGRWVVYNLFAKTSLGCSSDSIGLLAAAVSTQRERLEEQHADRFFEVWDVQCFSNEDGLLADPSRFERDVRQWGDPSLVHVKELYQRFLDGCFVVEDMDAYAKRFMQKTSLLDRFNFGNFHQQLGQHLALKRRESAENWWINQKFTDDLEGVRENLYGAVQEWGLRQYFSGRLEPGDFVVDLGCGTGYYSKVLGTYGASVRGYDPSRAMIDLAQRSTPGDVEFKVAPLGTPEALQDLPDECADYVTMIDALLFYFVPSEPDQDISASALFEDIRRVLKPDGIFISVEPHYLFWLQPWFGEETRPFTVMTEYCTKAFGVTPTISEYLQTVFNNGFFSRWMEELLPDPSFENEDRRAFYFARQFPLWHLFEFGKTPA
ncbi:MAG: hypothetical protein CME26_03165 [Gemmatimonadetes bacterium]|nr:hypothetical protein [Gemmatimonadota bacterium]|tara:strand:- start:9466 stop:10635 length:1170 start_codon:yes stop_codon:yes gene_type:complete